MAGETLRVLEAMRDYLSRRCDERLDAFLRGFDWAMNERPLTPRDLPCTVHLDRILAIAGEHEVQLARSMVVGSHALRWGQTYTKADFGRSFMKEYGWVEIFGTRGQFVNQTIAGGFLLLGPQIHYPAHHHIAEEIYIPLTNGTTWRKGESEYIKRAAGEIIHHPSNIAHAMETGKEPLLALYLWRGGPLDQRSIVTRQAK